MKQNNMPLIFKSKSSHYMYDDTTQIVLPISQEEMEFIKSKRFTIIPDEYMHNYFPRIAQLIIQYRLFNRIIVDSKYTKKGVEELLLRQGIKSLVLTTNDACNMRCKYCYFSDKYENTPTYSADVMSFDVAKKAVDFYFEFNKKALYHNPNLKYIIGFYGGEPLLNWQVIYQIVEYCRKFYSEDFSKMIFPITTNGLLLSEQKIQYMLNNNFIISVSIDGNEYEHDRNRVDIMGKGTFRRVYKSLENLEAAYEKIKSKTQAYYNILLTYDNKTDLIALNDFFIKTPWLDKKIFHINKVSPFNTTYYDNQEDDSIKKKFFSMQEELINIYMTNLEKQRSHFLNTYIRQMVSFLKIRDNFASNTLKGSCIPGEGKLHVDPLGNFHACEKINRLYPIGNVEIGFEVNAQVNMINKYIDFVNETCEGCQVRGICSLCYAMVQNDGRKFSISSKICKATKENVLRMLSIYYELLENNLPIMEV